MQTKFTGKTLLAFSWLARCFGILVFLSAKALAQGSGEPSVSELVSRGQIGEARFRLEKENASANERLFFEGQVLKAAGQLTQAAEIFRQVLRSDPDFINARRELAHTLLLRRDYRSASYHFRKLMETDPNEFMRTGYRRFQTIIDQNEPFGMIGTTSIVPSSNVNRGTGNDVIGTTAGQFSVDDASRAKPGVGLQFGLSGFLRHGAGTSGRWVADWSVVNTSYQDHELSATSYMVALSYEKALKAGTFVFGPFIAENWLGGSAESISRGVRLGQEIRLDGTTQLNILASQEYRDYVNQDYLDGPLLTASVTMKEQITTSASLSGTVAREQSQPAADHLKHATVDFSLGLEKAWRGGLETSARIRFGNRDFSGTFPLSDQSRVDSFYSVSLIVRHDELAVGGFLPRLSCSLMANQSNIDLFDIEVFECAASLSRRF